MPYILLLGQFLGMGIFFVWGCSILYIVITVACVIYVWNDCHRGNMPGIGWTVLALFTNVIGVIIYMIYKSTQPDRGWRG